MTKKIIDDYFAKNYNKILEISKNIQNKRLKDSECEYDTLVISCYEYCVTHIDGLPDNIESIVVNWMYKQVIWYGTKFKKEFVYRKDVPFSSMDDNIDRDFDVEEELDDIVSKYDETNSLATDIKDNIRDTNLLIKEQGKELEELKAAPGFSWQVKLDTGDPAEGWSGLFVENRFDNELRVYVDGAFRTVVAW